MEQLITTPSGAAINATRQTLGSLRSKVLQFCMKHPRMKFTLECIGLSRDIDKAQLERELQTLIAEGVIAKHFSDSGLVLYCAKKSAQELAELTKTLL